jgi:hypothetical protein
MSLFSSEPILVAARSKALACWDCGFESLEVYGCVSLVSVVYCQVEIYASRRSLHQRSPSDCGVSECDGEASSVRRSCTTWSCRTLKDIIKSLRATLPAEIFYWGL